MYIYCVCVCVCVCVCSWFMHVGATLQPFTGSEAPASSASNDEPVTFFLKPGVTITGPSRACLHARELNLARVALDSELVNLFRILLASGPPRDHEVDEEGEDNREEKEDLDCWRQWTSDLLTRHVKNLRAAARAVVSLSKDAKNKPKAQEIGPSLLTPVFAALALLGGTIPAIHEGGLALMVPAGKPADADALSISVRVVQIRLERNLAEVVAESGTLFLVPLSRLHAVPGVQPPRLSSALNSLLLDALCHHETGDVMCKELPDCLRLHSLPALLFARLKQTCLRVLSVILRDSEVAREFLSRGCFPLLLMPYTTRYSLEYLEKSFLISAQLPMPLENDSDVSAVSSSPSSEATPQSNRLVRASSLVIVIPQGGFQCERCTLVNPAGALKCSVCDHPRPKQALAARSAQGASVVMMFAPWSCSRCSLLNSTANAQNPGCCIGCNWCNPDLGGKADEVDSKADLQELEEPYRYALTKEDLVILQLLGCPRLNASSIIAAAKGAVLETFGLMMDLDSKDLLIDKDALQFIEKCSAEATAQSRKEVDNSLQTAQNLAFEVNELATDSLETGVIRNSALQIKGATLGKRMPPLPTTSQISVLTFAERCRAELLLSKRLGGLYGMEGILSCLRNVPLHSVGAFMITLSSSGHLTTFVALFLANTEASSHSQLSESIIAVLLAELTTLEAEMTKAKLLATSDTSTSGISSSRSRSTNSSRTPFPAALLKKCCPLLYHLRISLLAELATALRTLTPYRAGALPQNNPNKGDLTLLSWHIGIFINFTASPMFAPAAPRVCGQMKDLLLNHAVVSALLELALTAALAFRGQCCSLLSAVAAAFGARNAVGHEPSELVLSNPARLLDLYKEMLIQSAGGSKITFPLGRQLRMLIEVNLAVLSTLRVEQLSPDERLLEGVVAMQSSNPWFDALMLTISLSVSLNSEEAEAKTSRPADEKDPEPGPFASYCPSLTHPPLSLVNTKEPKKKGNLRPRQPQCVACGASLESTAWGCSGQPANGNTPSVACGYVECRPCHSVHCPQAVARRVPRQLVEANADAPVVNAGVWTCPADLEIIAIANNREIDHASAWDAKAEAALMGALSDDFFMSRYMALSSLRQTRKVTNIQILKRLKFLRSVNAAVANSLKYVDLSLPAGVSLLTDRVRAMRGLLLWSVKASLWESGLAVSKVVVKDPHSLFKVSINRFKAEEHKEHKDAVGSEVESCFGQFHIHCVRNRSFPKCFRLAPSQRVAYVDFVGLMSHDMGGPYRDLMELCASELMGGGLPLFIRAPNARNNIGWNRETFLPAAMPDKNSDLYHQRVSLLVFLGQFMGLAMRTHTYLSLRLPALVWKQLCGDVVTAEDLRSVDHFAFQLIDQISAAVRDPKMTRTVFNKEMQRHKFTTTASDGRIVPLIRDGRATSITWENKDDYIKLTLQYRMQESAVQMDAIRRGLATVVPYRLLTLFSWQEVERLVCGTADFDVKLLMDNVVYAGFLKNRGSTKITSKSPHVKMFWKMLTERFSNEDRIKWLCFTWGRSRLPLTSKDFERKFTIMAHVLSSRADVKADDYFPIAHTCFFQLELPEYSSLDIMTSRFLYAINNCTAVDGDNTSTALQTARMNIL